MLRELFNVLLSIMLSTHEVPIDREIQLANLISQRAEYASVDPFIVVAIITHESEWHERAISVDGLDYGLMQVRAQHYMAGQHSDWLLNGEFNIKLGTDHIKRDIAFCRNRLHREPTTQEWLSVYQGSVPSCKPTKLTKQVEDYQFCLQDVIILGQQKDCREIYRHKP